MAIISIKDVTYWYKGYNEDGKAVKQRGITNVSLDIEEGTFVAIVGHNGCGKSTLAKHLNGLLIPKSGVVEVLGNDTSDKTKTFEIRKNVGMVFQNPDNQMVASIVEDDVAFGPENLGVPQPEIVERVRWALDKVNMTEYAERTPNRLSGGQKQRIAIAGALAIKPQVLVLDESTAMLDPQGRKEVIEVARELNSQGMTIVLITHFMEEVFCADTVVVMNQGKIVGQGTPFEIFDNSELIESVGLKIPRTIELAQKLNTKNITVDTHTTDAHKLGEDVCQLLQKI